MAAAKAGLGAALVPRKIARQDITAGRLILLSDTSLPMPWDYVLVYSNDCSDGTDLMLDRLAELGWLTHIRNPGPHDKGPQWEALRQADRHPLRRAADWIMVFDVDEFVNIHVGDRTIPALLAARHVMRVMVIDNASKDDTCAIVERLAARVARLDPAGAR